MGTKFNEDDIVININNGQKYCIEKVDEVFDVDSKSSRPTGYYECKPINNGEPAFNWFHENDLDKPE